MAKLENFVASVEVPSGLKPMGDNTFPIAQAHDILVGYNEDGSELRLDDKLDSFRASRWYWGTKITGELQTPTAFPNSDVLVAAANDMYLNTDNGNVYFCTAGGAPSVATWSYRGNLRTPVDTTLSQPNQAAEAQAVGNELQNIKDTVGNLIPKDKISLGFNEEENRIYLHVDGEPVGNGVALPSGGASGDVVGNIDSEKNIILSGGNIVAGEEYSFYYKVGDDLVLIGSKVLEEVEEPEPTKTYTITNNLVACKNSNEAETVNSNTGYQATITPDADAEPVTDKKYVGITAIIVKMGGVDISSTAVSGSNINIPNVTGNIVISCIGYKTGVRLSLSSGTESGQDGTESTGFIPATQDSVIRIKNIAYSGDTTRGIVGYDAKFNKLTIANGASLNAVFEHYGGVDEANGVRKSNKLSTYSNFKSDSLAYIRLCSTDINETSIITVDEPIV